MNYLTSLNRSGQQSHLYHNYPTYGINMSLKINEHIFAYSGQIIKSVWMDTTHILIPCVNAKWVNQNVDKGRMLAPGINRAKVRGGKYYCLG